MTGLAANHADWDLPLPGFLHVSCAHHYRGAEPGESEEAYAARLAAELEETILREGPETVAAFIAEPVMGAGGAIVPPRGYFPAIQAVLAKYDVRLIADEVICGFGRLGTWFGSEALGIRPDSISFAKALTSAYMPLGGVSIDEPLYQALIGQSEKIGTFGHGTTYSGPSGGRRGGAEGDRDLPARPGDRGRRREGAAFPAPALGARRARHRRRGRGHRPDRRPGDRRRQGDASGNTTRRRGSRPAAWPSRRAKA